MPLPRSRVPDPLEMLALARALAEHPATAVRAARVSVVRLRRALTRSPRSLFLRELVTQPMAVGAICASSPHLAARMAALVDPASDGLVVELGGGTPQEVAQRAQRFTHTLTQVVAQYGRRVDALESADLRHAGGYALRLRGVTTVIPDAAGAVAGATGGVRRR